MYQKLLLMSLLTLLFGCGNNPKNKDQFPEVPLFPKTDNPACRLEPVPMDSDFFAQAFIITPDRKSVFVLAYDTAGTPDRMPYQLLRLDAAGQVQAKIAMPDSQWEDIPCFWWEEDGSLSLMLKSVIETFDPAGMKVKKEWRQINPKNFLPRERLDQLTYDEQDTAYREAVKTSAGESRSGFVLETLNRVFLMLDYDGKPSRAWLLSDEEDIERYKKIFGLRKGAPNPAESAGDGLVSEDTAGLSYLSHDILDYKIAYPNLQYIESRTLALSIGNKKARFKLSNKDGHSLNLQFADNQYLTTADGTVWLMYERDLYRVRIP